MRYIVTGRIHELESDLGVPGLHVAAFDKDRRGRDSLGQALTNADGRFKLSFDTEDFADPGEGAGPDLYVEVRAPRDTALLHTTEPRVRMNAAAQERFSIGLSRDALGALSPSTGLSPGAAQTRLEIHLLDEAGKPIESKQLVIITEHKRNAKKQRKVTRENPGPFEVEIAPGQYTIQGYAKGYDVAGTGVDIRPGEVERLTLSLKKVAPDHFKRTPAQRLAVYGLAEHDRAAELTLSPGQTLVLDGRKDPTRAGMRLLKPKSIRELKRWVGSKDQVFGHKLPRFGPIPVLHEEVRRYTPDKKASDQLSTAAREQIKEIAREYLHGNSGSVAQFESVLDGLVLKLVPELWAVLHVQVTIPAGSTLVVGKNSNLFYADLLRIHKTGTLKIVGDCKVDIGRLEEFE